jgi:hypothetical protein
MLENPIDTFNKTLPLYPELKQDNNIVSALAMLGITV